MKELFDKVSLKCSKLTTKSYSTSFSLGIQFLNKEIHDEIYAIYGFVRYADEIVDSFHGFHKEELLKEFNNETWKAINRGISLNPILNSFQWVVNEYNIDHKLIESFLESMSMDLTEKIYDQKLYEKYILGSAEVVGLMCLKVFVNGSQERYEALKPAAMRLGAAFQKINFLRDLGKDSEELGRHYFPQLQNQKINQKIKDELVLEIKNDFDQAYLGIKELPLNSRLGVYIAFIYYKNLLHKISKSSIETISNNRIRISNFKKIGLALKAYSEYKLKLSVFNRKALKTIALILLLILSNSSGTLQAKSLEDIRKSYIDCDVSKESSNSFFELVEKSNLDKSINKAYLAAAKMVKAKFGINPISKLLLFKEGRDELEKLIKSEPNNIEMKYIRLAIQHTAPKFLSYRDNLEQDRLALIKHLNKQSTRGDLESNIIKFLKREKLLNKEEQIKLNV